MAIARSLAIEPDIWFLDALSHPLGALYGVHHGTTNAVLMPSVLQFNRPAIESVIEGAAQYSGIDGGFDGFCVFVDDLNVRLYTPKTLGEMGVTYVDVDRVVRLRTRRLAAIPLQ